MPQRILQIELKNYRVKHRYHLLYLILCLLIIHYSGSAQESKTINLLNDNIESILPPLEVIIDSALAHNPSVRFRDLQTDVNMHKLTADRRIWTKNIGFQTDVRYGTFDNFSTNTAEGQTPSVRSTQNSQMNYGAGAFLKFPIYDFVNRKNQINLDKAEIEQAKSMAEFQRNEIRQLVIKQYNDLIIKQKVLKIKIKYAETSKINMQMVEKEFLNGVISVSEYARQSEAASRTEIEAETSRMDFLTSYMIMEEIVGIKFKIKF